MNTPELIITLATPVFFALIALELLVAKLRGRKAYHGSDAINSIGLGVISQIVGVFAKVLSLGIYAWCVEHLALFTLSPGSLWVWASGLLLYDFLYYWLHRCGHEVNILWAAHVVHHQSEDYNLSTALRQTSSGALLGWLFYLPMALLGYPLQVFVVVALIDLLYQFWVHTEMVGRLGWFDRVFCSPSNHRAHHAVNDRYLDRNYGGILILWDRLFGSFVEEDDNDPPLYGTRSPLRSWNPLWANAEVYWATLQDCWHARRWRDKLLVWLKPPGWRPADVAERYPKPAFDLRRKRFEPPISRALIGYCLVQFALLLAMATQFLQMAGSAGMPTLLAYAGYLVFSLCVLGALMEGRRQAFWLEGVRVLATAIVPLASGRWFGLEHLAMPLAVALLLVFALSATALPWLRRLG
ncbi:sterol desaturase family protein [Dyella tabacisoli]|uniref:Sterol desaturase family protein n=1 Tax=Dyella tabacisoli TaxID=2282381 RepID=A0A369UJH4_9GAMM|nr:sterol desaturase family protein [Dyella tabacisoli]RDD80667.1 sterol desaturase family protein [Dyella tabacisoli]